MRYIGIVWEDFEFFFGLGVAEAGRDKIKVLVVAVRDFVNLCSRQSERRRKRV